MNEYELDERRALLLDAIEDALAEWDFDTAERLQIALAFL